MKKIFSAIAFSLATLIVGSASAAVYVGKASTTAEQDLYLRPFDRLFSENWKYVATMQQDGNLVIYRASDMKILWWTGTQNRGGAYAVLKRNYNLGIYTADGRQIWSNEVAQNVSDPATTLQLANDGLMLVGGTPYPGSPYPDTIWWAAGRDNWVPTCASGAPTLHPICIYRMSEVMPACGVAEATAYAVANGGTYGACP